MVYGEVEGIKKAFARVIQGTTMLGSDLNEQESFALLDQVYELGCNTLDTAHVYGGGDGGALARLADVDVRVPLASTPRVQEVQLSVLHVICELVEQACAASEEIGETS